MIYKRPKQIWQMENNLLATFDLIERNGLALVLDKDDLPLHDVDPHFLLLQLYNVYKSLKGKGTALRDLIPGAGDTKTGIAKDTNGASYVKNILFRKAEDPPMYVAAAQTPKGESSLFDAQLTSEEKLYLQQRRNRLDSSMPLPRKPKSLIRQDQVEAILRAQEVALTTPDRGASARPVFDGYSLIEAVSGTSCVGKLLLQEIEERDLIERVCSPAFLRIHADIMEASSADEDGTGSAVNKSETSTTK